MNSSLFVSVIITKSVCIEAQVNNLRGVDKHTHTCGYALRRIVSTGVSIPERHTCLVCGKSSCCVKYTYISVCNHCSKTMRQRRVGASRLRTFCSGINTPCLALHTKQKRYSSHVKYKYWTLTWTGVSVTILVSAVTCDAVGVCV